MKKVTKRERKAIIKSLKAGVVPKKGLQHILVGRDRELAEIYKDLEDLKEGASSLRLIIGKYGSGKTFFLSLSKLIAMKENFVVTHADLSPTHKLYHKNKEGLALYREITENMATRSSTSALPSIVERFIDTAINVAKAERKSVDHVIEESLDYFRDLNGGYYFSHVIQAYWKGHINENEELRQAAVRWLRGEYNSKTEARKELGAEVRDIISDSNYYDYLKLFALFCKQAGYEGLMVCLDEAVNICFINHRASRDKNYEWILRILNDILQGETQHLFMMIGGTVDFLEDPHRGVASHDALSQRLEENSFESLEYQDFSGPVIRLSQLTKEELFSLLEKVRGVMLSKTEINKRFPDQAIEDFMEHCFSYIGEVYFRTPRKTIKSFVSLLAMLLQYPELKYSELLQDVEVEEDREGDDDFMDHAA